MCQDKEIVNDERNLGYTPSGLLGTASNTRNHFLEEPMASNQI